MSAREIGCFLSHRKTWKLIVESDEPWAFVCEDDIHMADNFTKFLETSAWMPENADIVKAETMRVRIEMSARKTAETLGHCLRELRSEHLGSAGYFVSREASTKLLALTEECCEPADRVLFSPDITVARQLNIHQLDPALCIQDYLLVKEGQGVGFITQIPQERGSATLTIAGTLPKLWREIKRPMFQLAAFSSRMFLVLSGQSVFKSVPINLARKWSH